MMPLIELVDVSKHYTVGAGAIVALEAVSLSVDAGQSVAITGSSGSGKSTLLNLIGCLDTPTAGSYALNGRSVSAADGKRLARIRNEEVGFVFQGFHLLPRLTAIANVMQPLVYRAGGGAQRRALARDALARVGLLDRAEHLPAQLSGGQQQRVAIARAIVTRPAIILADEPTGNLDSAATRQVMNLFDDLHSGGQTLLVVTHEADVAARCERAVELADGRIARDERD